MQDTEQHRSSIYSNALICITEFHFEASKLLLEKLNYNTSDRYIMLSENFSDDFIAIYLNERRWRVKKNLQLVTSVKEQDDHHTMV